MFSKFLRCFDANNDNYYILWWGGCIRTLRYILLITYPTVYGWMIALATISLLIWIISSILIIVWPILYYKSRKIHNNFNAHCWHHVTMPRAVIWPRLAVKISTFTGVLSVAVTLQLAIIIVWGMFMDTLRTQNSELCTHIFNVGKVLRILFIILES